MSNSETPSSQPVFRAARLRHLSRLTSRLSLNRRFGIAIFVVMACSLALGTGLIVRYRAQLESSRDDLERLADFRLALNVANRISAERGPTNRMLSVEPAVSGSTARLLHDARMATDAALAQAAATPAFARSVPVVRDTLRGARQQVDVLVARPLAARSTADVARAVDRMFSAYDATAPLVQSGMAVLLAARNDLVGRALAMQMLSELRDYAGRLGSYLAVPMIRREPLDPDRRAAYEQTRGRVAELWHLVSRLTEANLDPAVEREHQAVVARFFGDGAALLQREFDASVTGQYGSATSAAFTAALVPTFAPLEGLRDAFIDATVKDLRASASAARRALVRVAVATALALLFELWLLLASERQLFRPLLAARRRIVDLADGQLGANIDPSRGSGEIRELYEALASLREKLIERVELTDRLRQQAETDGLTGVLNRRALDSLGEHLTRTGDGKRRLGVIMLDIDHFKRVNDTWGHGAGDEVLKETAHRLRSALRSEDVLARYGGEEFVVVLADDGKNAHDIAERLRRAIEAPPFVLSTGERLAVTASFGTALAELRPGVWQPLVEAADEALYRAKESGRNRVETQNLA